MTNKMQHFEAAPSVLDVTPYRQASVTLESGLRVHIELSATYLHSDSVCHTFQLDNGVRVTLPHAQTMGTSVLWHGKLVEP